MIRLPVWDLTTDLPMRSGIGGSLLRALERDHPESDWAHFRHNWGIFRVNLGDLIC